MSHPTPARRRLAARFVAVGAAALVIGSGLAPTAQADPNPMEKAFAEHEGITVAQARTQIASEAKLSTTAAGLEKSLPTAAQAGSWIDGDTLTVAVTTPEAAAQVEAAGATAKLVDRSGLQLDITQTKLDRLAKSGAGKVLSWGVDVRTNAVKVTVPASATDAATTEFVAAAKKAGATVETTKATPTLTANVLGGQEYTIDGSYLCSVGFGATDSSGDDVIVTAGHCTEGASSFGYNGSTLGTLLDTSFPGDDYGAIQVSASHTAVGAVDNYSGGQVAVKGSTAAAVGATVCKSGRTTDWTCGAIVSKNQSVNYGDGDVVSGLTEHSACVEQGDSGGSNLSGSQAQGLTSGAALYQSGGSIVCGEKVGEETVSYFQPVNEALSTLGLTLKTS